MAHTYTGSLLARASSAGNPITVSLTVPAGCTVVGLLLKARGATNRAGGSPTWGSYTFTQANSTQKAAASPEASVEVWYLLNPRPGTATLTIPNTGALTIFREVVGFSAAAGRVSVFEAANGSNGTSTNPTPGAVTILQSGAAVLAANANGATTWAPSAQVGTVISNVDDGADGYGSQYALNPAVGSYTLSWTFGTSDDWGAVVASFREEPAVNMENYHGIECASAGVISVGDKIR